jgi:translation initiation factor 3 subunit A
LNQDYEIQLAQESRLYEQNRQQKLVLAAARHKESINLKKRLERVLPDYKAYRTTIQEKKSEEFQARQNEAHKALEAEKAKRRAAFNKFQEEERHKREAREREEELERERQRKKEEEAHAKEEAARKEIEEKNRIREEERRYEPSIARIHKLTTI